MAELDLIHTTDIIDIFVKRKKNTITVYVLFHVVFPLLYL